MGVLAHVTCEPSGPSLHPFQAWVPSEMANSPYGGVVWANASIPQGPFLDSPEAPNWYEIGLTNGSAAWAGFGAEFNVTPRSNQSVLGPGLGTPCSTPFQISPTFWGGIVLGGPLLGSGNMSDVKEPSTLNAYIPPSTVELGISDGYSVANHDAVSTCGGGAVWRWANSTGFTATVPVMSGGSLTQETFAFPFFDSFHYWFPANYGVWQIDNLSAPGGPGGGWAFSYTPC